MSMREGLVQILPGNPISVRSSASVCHHIHILHTILQSYFLRLHAFINQSEANRSMGMSMLSCHDKGTYCCGEEACDCNTGSGTITLKDSASAFTTIGLFQSPTTSESKASSTVPTPSSTNLSATSPNLGSSLSLFSVPHLPSASAPVASDLQQPRPSSPPSKLGIGTGVPIGILLVMALVFIVRHNRRLRTELQKFYNGLSPNNSIFNRFFLNRLKGSDRTKEMQNPIFELPTSSS